MDVRLRHYGFVLLAVILLLAALTLHSQVNSVIYVADVSDPEISVREPTRSREGPRMTANSGF